MKPSGYNTQKLAAEAAAMEVRLPCTVAGPAAQNLKAHMQLLKLLNDLHTGPVDSPEAEVAEGQGQA
jgi:hypothetical protein